ncbi:MAG: ribosome silencing factor [candidate division KSB1 bacterium]|nr:ribosome silencing factor [candidate division KSB1 bacterium]MDZ7346851.1 ribosome silencing factor [candidate division KSB1 bacterium]
MESIDLARAVGKLILDKKGREVVILDLRRLTSITDYFVICTVDAEIQAKAVVEHIREELGKQRIKPWHIEGLGISSWVLMDFVDIVVHIFLPETRMFYNLERLWGDAPREDLKE